MAEDNGLLQKNWVKTFGSVLAGGASLLYVVGYTAERVHWNVLGHIETPINHIEYLYRGGNLIIGSVADILLGIQDSAGAASHWGILLLVAFAGLGIAQVCAALASGTTRNLSRWRLGAMATFGASLVCTIFLSASLLNNWPQVMNNLLFELNQSFDEAAAHSFYRQYVCLALLWSIVLLTNFRIEALYATSIPPGTGNDQSARSVSGRTLVLVKVARWTVVAIVAVFVVMLPLVYGTYKYPNTYATAEVLMKEDLVNKLTGKSLYLLYETPHVYVLYARTPAPSVLRIERSAIVGLKLGVAESVLLAPPGRAQTPAGKGLSRLSLSFPSLTTVMAEEQPKKKSAAPAPSNHESTSYQFGLLQWLRGISEIRDKTVALEMPDGRVLPENTQLFRWRCVTGADYYVLRLTVEEQTDFTEREFWRSEAIPADRCEAHVPMSLEGRTGDVLFWHLEVYKKQGNADRQLLQEAKAAFTPLPADAVESVKRGRESLSQWRQADPTDESLFLLGAAYYAVYGMRSAVKEEFKRYLGVDEREVISLKELSQRSVAKLGQWQEELSGLQNKLEAKGEESAATPNVAQRLAELNVFLLEFDQSLYWVDRAIALTETAEGMNALLTLKHKILARKVLIEEALNYGK
jgi:hypothetical protein